jgi:hypothetical protein
MIRHVMASGILILALSACAAAQKEAIVADGSAAPTPGATPKGRVIIDGAMASKGDPPTYQISYVADAAVAGKPLRAVLKSSIRVEKMLKNPKTGQDEKKMVNEPVVKAVPIALGREGTENISLAGIPKESPVDLYIAPAGEGDEPISNTLTLRQPGKDGVWRLPEAIEVSKIAQALPEKAAAAPARPRKLLAFTYAAGFRHTSIPVCARAVQMLGDKTGAWKTVISNDRFMFEPETLAQFDAVMMCSTTGSLFGDKANNERLRKNVTVHGPAGMREGVGWWAK